MQHLSIPFNERYWNRELSKSLILLPQQNVYENKGSIIGDTEGSKLVKRLKIKRYKCHIKKTDQMMLPFHGQLHQILTEMLSFSLIVRQER